MKNILDASFVYYPSFATDIKKTFERMRAAQTASAGKSPVSVLRMAGFAPTRKQACG